MQPLRFETRSLDAHGRWLPDELDPTARQRLAHYVMARAPLALADEMDPEHLEQLRALGYLPPVDEPAESSRDE